MVIKQIIFFISINSLNTAQTINNSMALAQSGSLERTLASRCGTQLVRMQRQYLDGSYGPELIVSRADCHCISDLTFCYPILSYLVSPHAPFPLPLVIPYFKKRNGVTCLGLP